MSALIQFQVIVAFYVFVRSVDIAFTAAILPGRDYLRLIVYGFVAILSAGFLIASLLVH